MTSHRSTVAVAKLMLVAIVMITPASAFFLSRSRRTTMETGTAFPFQNRSLQMPPTADWKTIEIQMPWDADKKAQPLTKCMLVEDEKKWLKAHADYTDAENALRRATSIMCHAGLGPFVEFYVDPRFAGNYQRLKDKDGWIENAFVTYMKLNNARSKRGAEESLLVQSVHHFSKFPVILTNVGNRVPAHLTPERYPHLVIMHARKSASEAGKDFNFNKLNAMLFTKVKNGIVLDADQWVNTGVDAMFQRVTEETTKEYPYPILPTHFMTRQETQGGYAAAGYGWHFTSNGPDVPVQKMSWGHAHPTWTYYALPWLARWVSYAMAPHSTQAPNWLKQQGGMTDEDLLNTASWADGLTKQWCKFDIEGASMYRDYVDQMQSGDFRSGQHSQHRMTNPTNKYYPNGIPHSYITCHDAKDPVEATHWLSQLWMPPADHVRLPIQYDGKWFADGKALKEYDPSLMCII